MEPCAGMLNIMHTLVVNGVLPCVDQWFASDINPDLVALLQNCIATGSRSFPELDAFTEARYKEHDESSKDPLRDGNAERAYFGLATTYANIWFNRWNAGMTSASGDRPYKLANFRKGLDNLHTGFRDTGIVVECKDLLNQPTPVNTIVYVDPPYKANTFDKNPHFKLAAVLCIQL
jgi:site-specific DNA-adenine methylase